MKTLIGHTGYIHCVTFSPDGKTLASGGGAMDEKLLLWDVQTGELVQTVTEDIDMVNSLAYSADGKMLASSSHDNTILLWDLTRLAVNA